LYSKKCRGNTANFELATLNGNFKPDPDIQLGPGLGAICQAVFKVLSGLSKIPGNLPASVGRISLRQKYGDETVTREVNYRTIASLNGLNTAIQEILKELSRETILTGIDQLLGAIDVNA
jgi:hypothetical protein